MSRASRKLEHLKLAVETGQSNLHGLQNVHFVHQAIPETSLNKVSIATSIGGLDLSTPIIINAMTGGGLETTKINEQLALIAKETGLAIAVGSQMSGIKNKDYISTYKVVRKVNPNGIVFANLGAEATVEQANQAIEMIEADALQIHLNVIQELIMPEGDRDFEGVLNRLYEIKNKVPVPVIIKEVGYGISKETAKKLVERGLSIIDVGGKGGTNFTAIENKRRYVPISIFNDWGINTATSILEVKTIKDVEVIATGGIQDSIHIAKALGLGASAVGMAGTILKVLLSKQVSGTIEFIQNLHYELQLIMTSLGANTLLDLQNKPMVIHGELKDWCELRGIPIKNIANRNND